MSIAIGNAHEGLRGKPSDLRHIEKLEILAPFMPRAVVNELCSGRVFQEYRRARLERFRAMQYRAIWEQEQMMLELRERETRFVDGIGQHKMVIHPLLHAIAEKKWGRGCWQDKSFREDTYKKSPEVRVPAPPRRLFPVNGFKSAIRHGENLAGSDSPRVQLPPRSPNNEEKTTND